MTSEDQENKIRQNILKVAKDLIENGGSIKDVARRTDLSSSTVQRYLNDSRLSEMLGKETVLKISTILEQNKANGLRKGGINSTLNNEPLRDEQGHFVGNKKR